MMGLSKRLSRLALLVAATAMMGVISVQPTLAQGPTRPPIDVQAFNACTTTNYADIAAKALGITAATLRKDIVSGETLQDIATGANVDIQTVNDALRTARNADIDQAVKDAVMTQDEATALESAAAATPAAPPPNATRAAPAQGAAQAVPFPDISNMHNLLMQIAGTQPTPGGRGGGFGFGMFNMVHQYAVVGDAIGMKCADVVKTLITPPGESAVTLASSKNIDQQVLIDALTKAYKDALAQDVTDGVIAQADSDQLAGLLDKAIAGFINNPLPMGPQPTQAQ